jgi:hypothetical protein
VLRVASFAPHWRLRVDARSRREPFFIKAPLHAASSLRRIGQVPGTVAFMHADDQQEEHAGSGARPGRGGEPERGGVEPE